MKERHKEARGLVIIEVQQSPQGRDTGKARLGLDGSVSRKSSIGQRPGLSSTKLG